MAAILKPFISLMEYGMSYFYGLTGSYGWSIVLLTIAVRVVILPLTLYQQRSMRKVQALQPKVKELQAKYKSDPEKLNKELMELYRTEKANPLMGCLPLLIQLPFLWGLFDTLKNYPYQGTPSFLWITNLADPTKVADPYYVLVILTALATLWSSYSSGMGTDPTQKTMLYVMPLLFAWFTLSFPAGVAVYWVVSTLIQVVQNYVYPGVRAPKGETAAR